MNTGSKFFSVMVVGENPEELIKKYDINLKVEPYIKYKYSDAEKLKNNAIKVLDEIIKKHNNFSLNDFQIDYFKERRKAFNNMSSFEYYQTITNGLYYDKNGDALSEKNPNGKWTTYRLGEHFSLPLKLKNGKESYQAICKDVDWDKMNMNNTETYEMVWDLMHGGENLKMMRKRKFLKIWKIKAIILALLRTKKLMLYIIALIGIMLFWILMVGMI